ncbi:MAG: class I SAM-dependent methyltransferase [Lachnospiraceae bacterium]|nr:class I SAM-dependent methyltransferase [Lachnospiraceae bacterium]
MSYIYDSEMPFEENNRLKKFIKKSIRKNVSFLLKPYIEFQNQVNQENEKKYVIVQKTIEDLMKDQERMTKHQEEMTKLQEEMTKHIEMLEKKNERYERHLDKMQGDIGAVSRQLMWVKWKELDRQRKLQEKEDDVLTCDICGHSDIRAHYDVKVAECIFNGGQLVRYVCPQCGVIFGPSKFKALGQDGINEDYWVHYLGFKEGDSTEKEIRAFKMLNPSKEKVYLNYGCGSWSKSVELLREEGYQVYGFEPYAADIDNPYIIGGKENIKDMRFDGIFSNDLLEHLINPIEDLQFMKTLLLKPGALMAHSTGCFEYVHEITRFHTHFFTGESANILADKAGFEIVEKCDDLKENDFICCVFKMKDEKVEYLSNMFAIEGGEKEGTKLILPSNAMCIGPYIDLGADKYCLRIVIEGDEVECLFKCTSNMGESVLYEKELRQNHNEIQFRVEHLCEKIEFTLKNTGKEKVKVVEISLI